MKTFDALVIGTGIAGGTTALRLAQAGLRVGVLTKAERPEESATYLAQGGIVFRGEGDPEALVQDILQAGAGAGLPEAARILAEEGPRLLQEIVIHTLGVQFDRADGDFHLTREAAHRTPRILHVGDETGKALEIALLRHLDQHPNIALFPGHLAVDLITPEHHGAHPLDRYAPDEVLGVYAFERRTRRVHPFLARAVVLATGGLGQIYLHTTNPRVATGDGFAMAYRAGARLINMEYIQFHPTALYSEDEQNLLITEAMRGEGAVLKTPDGKPFMERYHPAGSLAPRDIVARAIHEEMTLHGYRYVLLDIASYRPAEFIRRRFPGLYHRLLERGIDITREPIPVVPVVHFACGGVKTDLWGRTLLKGLYAVGEVACNGLHGANRLASTSLLEGLVFGDRAARAVQQDFPDLDDPARYTLPEWVDTGTEEPDPALIQQDWVTLKHIMWNYVGVVRTRERLQRAVRDLRHLWLEVENFYRNTKLCPRLIELRNGLQTALVVARSALRNPESRGTHYRKD